MKAAWLAVALLALGCLGGPPRRAEHAGPALPEIRLAVEPVGRRVTLTHDGDGPARLLPGADRSARPILRLDVRRADGEWAAIRRVPLSGAPEDFDTLLSGTSVVIGERSLRLRPGVHRWAARVSVGEHVYEVLQEVRVTGWSPDTVAAARALLVHPDADGCGVRPRVLSALLPSLERSALLALEADLRPAEQPAFLRELIERGGFTDELVSRLSAAPLGDVVSLAYELDYDELETVGFRRIERSLLARRLFEVVADHDWELGTREARALLTFARDWPASGPETIVDRLERGVDQDAALARLLDVARFHPDRASFDASRITAALARRCADAGAALSFHCDQARARFAGSGEEGRLAGPLAATETADVTARPSPPGAPGCHDVLDAWYALEDAASEGEEIPTGHAIEPVDPDPLEGDRLVRDDGHPVVASPR